MNIHHPPHSATRVPAFRRRPSTRSHGTPGAATGFCLFALTLLSTALGQAEPAAAPPPRPPARRLLYRTVDSVLIRGRAEVEYRYDTLQQAARPLPYQSSHEIGRRQYEELADREVFALAAMIQVRMIPDYYMESYLDPQTLRPLRAVRWKRDFPDVLFDFTDTDVLLTRVDPAPRGVFKRIGGLFTASETEIEMHDLIPPIPVGSDMVDLMTTFFLLEQKFTDPDGPPRHPFYLTAMRKGDSNVYMARFEPMVRQRVTLMVNRQKITRTTIRCDVTLQYGAVVEVHSDTTLESLAAEYMPERETAEAVALVEQLLGDETLDQRRGRAMVLPVAMPVYNRIFDEDKEFEGPFGLSESVTVWIDEKLGIPLRAECRLYGISGAIMLDQCDPDYFRLLDRRSSAFTRQR